MPRNSRWWWQICTKAAKTVFFAGASLMLIGLNSLYWQQCLVHARKERSKPLSRFPWMLFQVALQTKVDLLLWCLGTARGRNAAVLAMCLLWKGALEQASIRDRKEGPWLPGVPLLWQGSSLSWEVESSFAALTAAVPGWSSTSAWAYCGATILPFQKDLLRGFWVFRSLASVWFTAFSSDNVSCSTAICLPGAGIRPILERVLSLSWIRKN